MWAEKPQAGGQAGPGLWSPQTLAETPVPPPSPLCVCIYMCMCEHVCVPLLSWTPFLNMSNSHSYVDNLYFVLLLKLDIFLPAPHNDYFLHITNIY